MTIDEAQYNDFVASSPQGTLFATSWWLDTVAPSGYRILTVEKGGSLFAAWPIVYKYPRLSKRIIGMPPLTPWLGVIYRPARSPKLARQLSNRKDLSQSLIEQLPRPNLLYTSFHRNFEYWLPFYWQDFQQTTYYTYVLDDLSDLDGIWKNFRSSTRRNIKKAQNEGVVIEQIDDLDAFWDVHKMTFARQGMAVPYSFDLVRAIDAACRARGVRKIFVGRGKAGDIHAAAYIIWDDKSAYYLMGGGDPDKRSSGANSLLFWEAIQFSSTVANVFDFEGSMIEPVERFFRAFGARPCPYSVISNLNPMMEGGYKVVRDVVRSLKRSFT
jgi:hypothetical protein